MTARSVTPADRVFDPRVPFFQRDGVVRRFDSGDEYSEIREIYWCFRLATWMVVENVDTSGFGRVSRAVEARAHARLYVVMVPTRIWNAWDDEIESAPWGNGRTLGVGGEKHRGVFLLVRCDEELKLPLGVKIHEDSAAGAAGQKAKRRRT